MLRSMTAYGRSILNLEIGRLVIEIQSVNKRFCEVNLLLPRELLRFEQEIKKWIVKDVARGQVTLHLSLQANPNKSSFSVRPNLTLAKELYKGWEMIADELGIDNEKISLGLLAQEKGLLSFEDNIENDAEIVESLKQGVDSALEAFHKMKEEEGEVLTKEFLERVGNLERLVAEVKEKAGKGPERYRERLMKNINEVMAESVENEERILREVAIYADRIDNSEEISRLILHLKKFKEYLTGKELRKGKALEFLVQEMNREVNTLGAKSADVEISHGAVEMKSELEKIREQLQNVE